MNILLYEFLLINLILILLNFLSLKNRIKEDIYDLGLTVCDVLSLIVVFSFSIVTIWFFLDCEKILKLFKVKVFFDKVEIFFDKIFDFQLIKPVRIKF